MTEWTNLIYMGVLHGLMKTQLTNIIQLGFGLTACSNSSFPLDLETNWEMRSLSTDAVLQRDFKWT